MEARSDSRTRRRHAGTRRLLATALAGLALVATDGRADTAEAIHVFKGAHHGGVKPQGALLQASDGRLWGATSAGGENKDGIVFRMSLDGQYESVTGVPLAMGRGFVGDFVQAQDGTMFAVTQYGGDNDAGSIIAVGLDGTVSLVYSFNPAGWGGQPVSGLTKGSDGMLYGVIPSLDSRTPSAVYRLQPDTRAWAIVATLPHAVGYASARLVEGSDGAFYGIGRGNIFRVTSRGNARVIYHNRKVYSEGLVAGSDGNLYGTAQVYSADSVCGSVFRLSVAGESTRVRDFPCPNGYDYPMAGFVQGTDGLLHGSAIHLNADRLGYHYTLWSMALDGSQFTETRMRAYAGDGINTPIEASDGAFYATAPGGKFGEGTLVRITP